MPLPLFRRHSNPLRRSLFCPILLLETLWFQVWNRDLPYEVLSLNQARNQPHRGGTKCFVHNTAPGRTRRRKGSGSLGVLQCVTSVFVSFEIPAAKLNELLENFYVTVKKSDGSDFLATSLHAIRRGLDRILKNAGVGFSITSSTFSSSTKKLKEKLWVLSKAGMSGARSRNIVYFSLSDEEEMWQAGCLGDDSPITLLSTVVKYNSQYLNMRTLQEHADLMYGDIELLKDPQNQPYFARTDSVKRESRSGSTRVCHGKIYHEHSRGHKQCPYCLLYKYMYIHRPPTQMEAKSPFYLTARKEATDTGSVWYEEQRMGLRSLRGIVPNLAKKVKLENCENFTFVSFTQVSRRLGSHSCCQ